MFTYLTLLILHVYTVFYSIYSTLPMPLGHQSSIYVQWGEQVFDTLPILQVFLLTKHVEVCNFYHRCTSTVRDGIQKITLYDF